MSTRSLGPPTPGSSSGVRLTDIMHRSSSGVTITIEASAWTCALQSVVVNVNGNFGVFDALIPTKMWSTNNLKLLLLEEQK